MQILASVFLGLIPEAIYFTLFLTYAKELKTRRALLFCMTLAASLIFSAFLSYTVWYHAALLAAMYLIMRLLYKSEIIDIFLIAAESIILVILGLACYFLIPNYAVALAVNRIAMFVVLFALKDRIRQWYWAYREVWNRREKTKIKSITVRNISVIALNLMLYIITIGMIFFSSQLMNHTGGAKMIWSYFGFCDTEDGE